MITNIKKYQLWPEPQFSLTDLMRGSVPSTTEIEKFFEDIYPNTYAVLMPSGRSCISLILQYLEIKRPDLVYIPPYSSHCVINAVGYVGTPSPELKDTMKAAICFHQWGYTHKLKTLSPIIEDSVDSLITSAEALFPNDGRFELLSLSKIYSSISGGLILCQNQKDAQKLRKFRNERQTYKFTHFFIRIMGQNFSNAYEYWNTVEPLNGYIPYALRANIWKRLAMMDQIIKDRRSKIRFLEQASVPKVLQLSENRLPICWAVAERNLPKSFAIPNNSFRQLREKTDTTKLISVYPLPLHEGVSQEEIKKWVSYYKESSN